MLTPSLENSVPNPAHRTNIDPSPLVCRPPQRALTRRQMLGSSAFVLFTLLSGSASAQTWSSSWTTTGGDVQVDDLQDAYSPGNLHLGLYPLNLHLGRTSNLNAGASLSWEAANVFGVQVSGYYPYYRFGKSDRSQEWYQIEGLIMLHGRSDQIHIEDFTLTSSSSSTQYGDTVYTSSSRSYVNLPARHRVYRGARLGVMMARMPAKFDGTSTQPSATVFADSQQLIGILGMHTSDSRDRHIYVSNYGVRGSTWWMDVYVDLLVAITQSYDEIEPLKDPSRLGFRLGVQQLMGRNAGIAFRAEGGIMPGRGGWYGQVGVGFGSNVWIGQEY